MTTALMLRAVKGIPLTIAEVDGNFSALGVTADSAVTLAFAAQTTANAAASAASAAQTTATNAATAASQSSNTKVISASRDLTAISGVVNYTGFVGTPKWIIIRGAVFTTFINSNGFSNGTENTCLFDYGASAGLSGNTSSFCVEAVSIVGTSQTATATFSADTVTLNWIKSGTPTGTFDFTIEAHF